MRVLCFIVVLLSAAGFAMRCTAAPAPTLVAQATNGSAAPAAQAAPPATATPQPASPAPLTGTAAWNALLGNTINGSTPDGAYIEYFAQDGTVVHVDRDGKDSGQWILREPTVCFTYPDEDAEDCRKLEVEGSKGAFIDSDGSRYHFDIVPGNPKHL